MAKIRVYSAMPLAVLAGITFACVITSPAPAASLPQGTPVTITGTLTGAAVAVQVKLGSTVLGSASIVGFTWSFSWTPQVGDVGAQTINAVATATNGAQASADGVPVTVAALLSGPLAIMAGALRFGFSGDVGLSTNAGTVTWVDQTAGAHNITGTGAILATGLNNLPVLQTNGTSHQLSSTQTIPAPGTSPTYVWMIARDDAHGTFAGLIALGFANVMGILKDTGAGEACLFDSGNFGPRHALGLTLAAFKRVRASFTGTGTDTLQVGLGTAVTAAAAGNTAGTGVFIGASNGTFSACTYAEIWGFSRVPTGPELALLDTWGNTKWAGTFA